MEFGGNVDVENSWKWRSKREDLLLPCSNGIIRIEPRPADEIVADYEIHFYPHQIVVLR